MTEQDLFKYISAKRAYRIALDDLREFCPVFYAANISHITGLPKGAPPYSPDRIAGKIEEKNKYIEAWERAANDRETARGVIDVALSALRDDHCKAFVYYRYIHGYKFVDIARRTRRSKQALYRDRIRALDAIKNL